MFAHERFVELLAEAGYSEIDFARIIGRSQPTVNRWGTGVGSPDPSSLKSIATALKVPPSRLWVVPPRKRNLAYYRTLAGYQTAAAARELGISPMQLWRIEKGKAKLDQDRVPQMAKLYGVSADRLQHAWDIGNRPLRKHAAPPPVYELVRVTP